MKLTDINTIPEIKYEGKDSKNPLAFKYYNPDAVILGKKTSEHLPFAMAWWHNLGACGADMFGVGTSDKSFGCVPGTMEHARAKVDVGFSFMKKLGIRYFCFHDVDLVPEDENINITNARLDEITDYIEKNEGYGYPLPVGNGEYVLQSTVFKRRRLIRQCRCILLCGSTD